MKNKSKWWLNELEGVAHKSFLEKIHQDLSVEFERRFMKKFDGFRFHLSLRELPNYSDREAPDFGTANFKFYLLFGMCDVFLVGSIEWHEIANPLAVRWEEDITNRQVVFCFDQVTTFEPDLLDDLDQNSGLVDLKVALKIKSPFPINSKRSGIGQEYVLLIQMPKGNISHLIDYLTQFLVKWNRVHVGQELKALSFDKYDQEFGIAICFVDSFRAEGTYFHELIENLPSGLEIANIEVLS